jgi:hypothetical protein
VGDTNADCFRKCIYYVESLFPEEHSGYSLKRRLSGPENDCGSRSEKNIIELVYSEY